MEELIRDLLKSGCEVASEIDGDISCFYCGAWLQIGDPHREDCAFVSACKAIRVEWQTGEPAPEISREVGK